MRIGKTKVVTWRMKTSSQLAIKADRIRPNGGGSFEGGYLQIVSGADGIRIKLELLKLTNFQ